MKIRWQQTFDADDMILATGSQILGRVAEVSFIHGIGDWLLAELTAGRKKFTSRGFSLGVILLSLCANVLRNLRSVSTQA